MNRHRAEARAALNSKVRASLSNLNATQMTQNAAEVRGGYHVKVLRLRDLSSPFDTLSLLCVAGEDADAEGRA